MTSDCVRMSLPETVGYRRLDLHGSGNCSISNKRRTRRYPAFRKGAEAIAALSAASSTVYVSVDENASEDELRTEDLIEPRPRNRQAPLEDKACDLLVSSVEIDVKENDSLSNIALRYNCKVSDMKRLNKLINEQDFYCLKRIRIPVIRHGVIEEQLRLEEEEANNPESLHCRSNENWLDAEFADSIASPSRDSQSQEAERLLLTYDHEIQNTLLLARFDRSTDDAAIQPPLGHQISKSLNWRTVLTCFVMFCVVIPIIGVLYLIVKHFLK